MAIFYSYLCVNLSFIMAIVFGVKLLAALLHASAHLALILHGDILVDWLAHLLPDILAILDRMGHLRALGLLEPVAPGGVLGPDLAAIAVLLPELLADLLLLVGALFLVRRLVRALLPMLVVALLLELLLVLDFLHRLAVFCIQTPTNWRCHGVADGQAKDENGRPHLQAGEI